MQEAALLECLEETEGFRDPADEMRFAACERALKQVTHTLERLSHAWKVCTPAAPRSLALTRSRRSPSCYRRDTLRRLASLSTLSCFGSCETSKTCSTLGQVNQKSSTSSASLFMASTTCSSSDQAL